jgi:restriction system protein
MLVAGRTPGLPQDALERTEENVSNPASESLCDPQQTLDSLTSEQFELLVSEVYRRLGFEVEMSIARSTTHEGDLTLFQIDECVIVRCDHLSTGAIGVAEIEAFQRAVAAGGAHSGVYVTSRTFSREARLFARGKQLRLLDAAGLQELIASVTRSGEDLCDIESWLPGFLDAAQIVDPACPACRSSMTLGHSQGTPSPSWSCAIFPLCSGEREARRELMKATAAA